MSSGFRLGSAKRVEPVSGVATEHDEIFVATYRKMSEWPTNICMNNLKQLGASINLGIPNLGGQFTLDAI